MFPQAAPAGCLSVNGDLIFNKPKSRVTIFAQGSRAEARTIFTAAPGQNAIFGAMPGSGAPTAGIQVYSVNLDSALPGGFRYGDLRATPGFIQLTCAALGPDSGGTGAPTPWPLRFLVNGRQHIIGIDGSWSFNGGQTILDTNGNLGLGVAPAVKLEIGPGGMLQFDSPGGNSFRNGYPNSDLLLTWNFNAGATIMSLDNAGNLAIAGTFNAAGGVTGLPTPAMVRIAQVVCAGSQTTVDFSGIPAGYTNLMVVWQGRSTSAAVGDNKMKLMINGDTISGHYQAGQYGSHASTVNTAGTTAATTAGADIGDMPGTTSVAVASGTGTLLIPGYSGTTFVKQVLSDSVEFYINNTTGLPRVVRAFQWSVASAINQLTFSLVAGNFLDGSTFTVYGLA
jgi:hypothetical protein